MACRDCGDAATSVRTVRYRDHEIASADVCEACWRKAQDIADRLRAEFDALLESGVSSEEANEIMIRRVDALASASPS